MINKNSYKKATDYSKKFWGSINKNNDTTKTTFYSFNPYNHWRGT